MRRAFLLLLFLLTAATVYAEDAHVGVGLEEPAPKVEWEKDPTWMFIPSGALWFRILQSSLIAVVDIDASLPPDPIPEKEYLLFPFTVREFLKGTSEETNLVLKVWPQNENAMTSVRAAAPTTPDDRLRILFVGVGYDGACYMDNFTENGVMRADERTLAAVKREIAAQSRALKSFGHIVHREELPHWETVSNAVAQLTRNADSQTAAVKRILALGAEAVPALVVMMDDRRELPVKAVSFPNPPGHWEAYCHYGPETVVDLIDALADHALGVSLSSIVNGGTEKERDEAVAQWRLLLIRWLNENQKAGRFLRPVLLQQ